MCLSLCPASILGNLQAPASAECHILWQSCSCNGSPGHSSERSIGVAQHTSAQAAHISCLDTQQTRRPHDHMSLRQRDVASDAMAGTHTTAAGGWSSSSTDSSWSWSSYAGRCSIACLLLSFAPVWVFLVAARVPPGLARFCLAIPALAAFMLAPFCFDYELEPLSIMAISYLSERLPATKVLAFCFGRGLLQELLPTCNLVQFTALTLCPLVPVQTGVPKTIEQLRSSMRQNTAAANALQPTNPQHLRSLLLTKTWIMAGVAVAAQLLSWLCHAAQHCAPACGTPEPTVYSASTCHAHNMAGMLGQMLQAVRFGKVLLAVGMYCAMAGMVEMTVLSCQMMCARGMALAAPFNAPYAATCMSEFWSVRWNIPQSQLLKALVYDPIMEGRWVKAHDDGTPTTRSSLFGSNKASISTASNSPFANSKANTASIAGSRSCSGRMSVDFRRSMESDIADGLDRKVPQLELSAAPSLSLPSRGGLGTNRRGTTRRALAVLATFAFSGIEHLVFYWYINRTIYTPWMLFFSGHGFLVIVESSIRRALFKRKQRQQAGQLTPAPSEPAPPPVLSRRPSRLGPLAPNGTVRSVSQCKALSQDDATSQISDQDDRSVRKSKNEGQARAPHSSEAKDTACCDREDSSSSSDSSSLISTCLSDPSSHAEPIRDSFDAHGKGSLLSRPRQRHGKGAQLAMDPLRDGAMNGSRSARDSAEIMDGARSVRHSPEIMDASRAAKGLGKNMNPPSSIPQARKTPGFGDLLQAMTSISKHAKASIRAGIVTLPQVLQRKEVCMALTLSLLHATACMGFYGALHDDQLVARVGRALCSMPQSMGSSMTWPGC